MLKKLILILFITPLILQAQYTQNIKIPSITFPMAKDENFKAIQRNCQWCHSYGYILNQGKQSKQFWHKVVIKMRDVFKAPISKDDEKITTEYLFKHYGNGQLK